MVQPRHMETAGPGCVIHIDLDSKRKDLEITMAKPILKLMHGLLPVALLITLLTLGFVWMFFSSSSRYSFPSACINVKSISSPWSLCNCSNQVSPVSQTNITTSGEVECSRKETVQVDKPCPEPQVPVVQNVIRYEAWWAQGKTWHYPVRFPRCSLDACFNFSRCDNMNTFKMFTYEFHNPPVRYFSKLNQTKWHTKDPEEACIFLVFLDATKPWPKHPRELPYWNDGLNHAIVTFADIWSQKGIAEDSIGKASLVVSEAHETVFRPGFDISVPLPPFYHFREFERLSPFARKYFITFKGLRYIGRKTGEGVLRSFDSFRNLHNGEDVVVVTSCKHPINDLIRKENSSYGIHCDEDDKLSSRFTSYSDLMNTTFGLVPAGISPNSYRFPEVLSAGAIPILIVDNYVKPFSNIIIWYRCILQFPSSEIHRIVPTVRAMPRTMVERRQRACLEIYHSHFQDESKLLESTVAALEERFLGAFPSFSSHLSDLYEH